MIFVAEKADDILRWYTIDDASMYRVGETQIKDHVVIVRPVWVIDVELEIIADQVITVCEHLVTMAQVEQVGRCLANET